MSSGLRIPEALATTARAEGQEAWLQRLPQRIAEATDRWSLRVGDPYEPGGVVSWVAPADDASGAALALKVERRHSEATHEADGLRLWDGDGSVALIAHHDDDDTIVLLLERCRPGTPLSERPEDEQHTVIAGLLSRLWRPVPPTTPFRSLQSMCDEWADQFEVKVAEGRCPLDPGVARTGLELWRQLPASADRHVLLWTDLHAGNVLSAQREPWLAIDPKPYVGDPAYDALQHLFECKAVTADPDGLVTRMADLLDLDPARLRQWLFARCVVESAGWPVLAEVARLLAPT